MPENSASSLAPLPFGSAYSERRSRDSVIERQDRRTDFDKREYVSAAKDVFKENEEAFQVFLRAIRSQNPNGVGSQ